MENSKVSTFNGEAPKSGRCRSTEKLTESCLGAGAGFLSILCAKYLNARYVAATDGSRDTVINLNFNIKINHLEESESIQGGVLDWSKPAIFTCAEENSKRWFDLIIGADIVSNYLRIPAVSSQFGEQLLI